MFMVSLFLSLGLVALLLCVVKNGKPQQKSTALGLAFLGIPAGMILMSAVLILNAVLVFLALAVGTSWGSSPLAIRRLIWSATALTYLILAGWCIHEMRDIPRLRERFPLESVSVRLAYEERGAAGSNLDQPLAESTAVRLAEYEQLLADRTGNSYYSVRGLEVLHSNYLHHFVNSPGFGVGRMRPRGMGFRGLESQSVDDGQAITLPPPAYDDPIREKDYRDPWIDPNRTASSAPGRDELGKLHLDGLLNFVNEGNFGYIRNRNAVAGFKPHQFSELPTLENGSSWQLDTLELISLLKHAEPVAYVSRELPRMDKLREVPVRPLTEHERAMLEGLRRGEDLQVRSIPDRLRMLGAIRAAEQCLRCHEVERGTLLGAFSYKLRMEQ